MIRPLLFILFLAFLISCGDTGKSKLVCEDPLPLPEESIQKPDEDLQKQQDSLDRIKKQQLAYNLSLIHI